MTERPKWRAYLELMHDHKPCGILYFWYSGLYGSFLSASFQASRPSFGTLVLQNIKLLIRSVLIHSWGATINDTHDEDLDSKVARTRSRPLPSGAISRRQAIALAATLEIAVAIFTRFAFSEHCFRLELLLLVLGHLYSFAKRVTYYPQVVLGLCTSWGIVITIATDTDTEKAVWNADPEGSATRQTLAAGCLFILYVAWTVVFDSINGARDVVDDIKVGVKSPMVRFQGKKREFLRFVAGIQCFALAAIGFFCPLNWLFLLATGAAVTTVISMVERVDLEDSSSCEYWFAVGNPTWVAVVLWLPFVALYV